MSKQCSSQFERRWWILVAIGLAQLMVVLDSTIVNVALPSAQRALHFSNDNRQWIVTAYALAFGSLLLVGGRMGDRFVRKWTRKAFGVYGAIAGAGAATGLLIGGVLTQVFSWRLTMFVNLAIVLPVALAALWLLVNERRGERPTLDLPGTAAVSLGLFALVYGLSNAETHSWSDPITIIMLIAARWFVSRGRGHRRGDARRVLAGELTEPFSYGSVSTPGGVQERHDLDNWIRYTSGGYSPLFDFEPVIEHGFPITSGRPTTPATACIPTPLDSELWQTAPCLACSKASQDAERGSCVTGKFAHSER
jgi:MFS family permease